MPKGKDCKKLLLDSKPISFKVSTVGESKYVDITLENITSGKVSFEIIF